MNTITGSLPDDDLAILRRFSKTQGSTAEEILIPQADEVVRRGVTVDSIIDCIRVFDVVVEK